MYIQSIVFINKQLELELEIYLILNRIMWTEKHLNMEFQQIYIFWVKGLICTGSCRIEEKKKNEENKN